MADGRGAGKAATTASSPVRASLDGANVEDEEADGMEVEVNMRGGREEKDKREERRANEERIAAIDWTPSLRSEPLSAPPSAPLHDPTSLRF